MPPDVCYIISHGFAARMILHSDVVPELRASGLSVAIVAPGADEPSLAAFARRHDIDIIPAPPRRRGVGALLQRSRPYVLEDIAGNPALRAKHQRGRAGRRRARLPDMSLELNRSLVRAPRVARWFSRLERSLLADRRVEQLLADLKPGLVVATYPINALESSFLHEAERASIPTVGQLLSWDNITCKGRFPVPPQHYLSWGKVMSAELREHYATSADRIHECGVAHFDQHVTAPSRAQQRQILEGLGLDPRRPYLFLGMSSPYFAPHEIDIVQWLAARVTGDAFGAEMQLVVRPHPQNVQGHMADMTWLARLRALVGPRVAVDYPSLEDGSLHWAMKEQDLPHLANLLAGCAMCLNSGSTLAIDAIVHDKPVVLTCFDADRALPWWQSARRLVEYPHLAKLIALGGVRTVSSLNELEAAIAAYLREPALDIDGRRRTREQECGPCDGRSSRRVAAALRDIRSRATGSAAPARAAS